LTGRRSLGTASGVTVVPGLGRLSLVTNAERKTNLGRNPMIAGRHHWRPGVLGDDPGGQAEAWIAPPKTRELREMVHFRMKLCNLLDRPHTGDRDGASQNSRTVHSD